MKSLKSRLVLTVAAVLATVAVAAGFGGAGIANADSNATAIALTVSSPGFTCGATLSAFVTDINGFPVSDGTTVAFSDGVNTILATTAGGSASVFVSGSTGQVVTVTSGAALAQATIPVACGGSFFASQIMADTSCTSTQAFVRVFVSDGFGNPVGDGTLVSFTSSPGTITPSATTVGGIATVVWTPTPGISGSATVTATVGSFGLQSSFVISCGANGGPASQIALFIPQSSVTCGSQAYVFVTGKDIFGNAAATGSVVSFSTDNGTIIPVATLTLGSGLSEFTAMTKITGTAHIAATAGGLAALINLPITCAVS